VRCADHSRWVVGTRCYIGWPRSVKLGVGGGRRRMCLSAGGLGAIAVIPDMGGELQHCTLWGGAIYNISGIISFSCSILHITGVFAKNITVQ